MAPRREDALLRKISRSKNISDFNCLRIIIQLKCNPLAVAKITRASGTPLAQVRPEIMNNTNVVSLSEFRQFKAHVQSRTPTPEEYEYQARILVMDKLELLEEMLRYQQERSTIGHLTPMMMIQGRSLFRALEEKSETQELRVLARSYRRHLEQELADHYRKDLAKRTR